MIMRISLTSAFAAAVLMMSSAAIGQPQPQREAEDSKIVCKTQAKTGTRFRDKICKTHAQWEELRIQQQRDAKELIDRPQVEIRRGG